MKNILITDEQIKQYKKGFLLIKNFFDKHEVISIKNQINRKIKQKKNKNFYFEKNKNRLILRRIEKVSDYSKSCRELLESKKLIKVLEQLQKKKVKLFKDKLNFKYPGGKGFAPHIDGHFYWKDKNNKIRKGWNVYSKNFINAVIPLEKSDKTNGTIKVASKKYTEKYLGKSWTSITSKLDMWTPNIKKELIKKFKFKSFLMNVGDVLFFDWKSAHCSQKNNSKKSRMIFYATYNNSNNKSQRKKYYSDKNNSKNSRMLKSLQI